MDPKQDSKPAPRAIDAIRQEYTQCAARLGEGLYKETVWSGEKDHILKRMVELNQEASQREALDKTQPAAEEPKVVEGEIVI